MLKRNMMEGVKFVLVMVGILKKIMKLRKEFSLSNIIKDKEVFYGKNGVYVGIIDNIGCVIGYIKIEDALDPY